MGTLAKIEFENFENRVRFINDELDRHIVTLGPKSYIVYAIVEASAQCNILIGNYCSIAHDVHFLVGMNHDASNVSTYPENKIESCDVESSTQETITQDKKTTRNINDYQISIGHDVWIGRGATILSGVKIGNGAIIGAQSVVAKDVPPYAVVVGNPGRVVKYRFDEVIIERLQAIKWWYWAEKIIVKNKELMRNPRAFTNEFYQQKNNKKINTATGAYLSNLRMKGIKIYYFIPDFEFDNGIWKNILKEYLEKYTVKDKVMLVLEISDEDKYKVELDWICDWINHIGNNAAGVMKNKNLNGNFSLDVLHNTDAFITTSAYESIQCIDYLSDYNVLILPGVNDTVFV